MPLNANALTTLAKLSAFLDEPIATGDPTMFAETLINGYSQAIQRFAEREFLPMNPATPASDPPVARKFQWNGSSFLSLAPWDLRSLGGAGFGGAGSITLYTNRPTASQRVLVAG